MKRTRAKRSVHRTRDTNLDADEPWLTVCNVHSTMVGSPTKKLAQAAARSSYDWCADCCLDGERRRD